MKSSDQNNFEVFSHSSFENKLGSSNQALYIYDYLKHFSLKTIIAENKYIDRDYLIDYSKFYARSFNVDQKYTKRYHFFSAPISNDEIFSCLKKCDVDVIKKLQESYLGFTVIKPVFDKRRNPFIGRTLLKTYETEINGENRFYLREWYNISLFGIPLKIQTLPFQAQDSAVGGCATSACWVALHPLSSMFGIQKYSPYELTDMSVTFPTLSRNFPSTGLTLHQIKSQFNAIGLETEFIDVDKIGQTAPGYTKNDDIVADAVKAYCNFGLPIIAALRIFKKPTKNRDGKESEKPLYHAVVISGYRHKNGKVTELYVHDDQIGPFHRVIPIGNFSDWSNEWVIKHEKERVEVERLIVPIYQKFRLNFAYIYSVYLEFKKEVLGDLKSEKVEKDSTIELSLVKLNDYKKFLLEKSFSDKVDIMTMTFPRFLWVIRYTILGKVKEDDIYDATSVFPILIKTIEFTD
ncbi:MAG: hypothetical protein WC379_16610 [Methanoregula sp.]|jgi:hypothetical protein